MTVNLFACKSYRGLFPLGEHVPERQLQMSDYMTVIEYRGVRASIVDTHHVHWTYCLVSEQEFGTGSTLDLAHTFSLLLPPCRIVHSYTQQRHQL